MPKITAPWTIDQVSALNRWQDAGFVHPFTCPNDSAALVATYDGWRCLAPNCGFRQNWAHDFMLNEPAFAPLCETCKALPAVTRCFFCQTRLCAYCSGSQPRTQSAQPIDTPPHQCPGVKRLLTP